VAANAKVNLSTGADQGKVTGWARACLGTVGKDCASADSTSGWDGWISLSGTNYTSPDQSTIVVGPKTVFGGGVTFDSSSAALAGFSWGSDVIGWLYFEAKCPGCKSGVVVDPPGTVNVTSCIVFKDEPGTTAGTKKITFRASATTVGGGSGAYQYSWDNGATFESSTKTIDNFSSGASSPIVIARRSGVVSSPFQCDSVQFEPEQTGNVNLLIANTAANLSSATISTASYNSALIIREQSFALKGITDLTISAAAYTCTGSSLLPNGTQDNPASPVWPDWTGRDITTATTNVTVPSDASTPSGRHKFTMTCTSAGDTQSDTVSLYVLSSDEEEI
jgi:hypothetical protein